MKMGIQKEQNILNLKINWLKQIDSVWFGVVTSAKKRVTPNPKLPMKKTTCQSLQTFLSILLFSRDLGIRVKTLLHILCLHTSYKWFRLCTCSMVFAIEYGAGILLPEPGTFTYDTADSSTLTFKDTGVKSLSPLKSRSHEAGRHFSWHQLHQG